MQKILIVPNPILRQKAKLLDKVTEEDIKLSKIMIDLMKKAPGVGLAANQIGVLKKIITINIVDKEKKTDKTYALFNPNIKKFSKQKTVMEEGCLSLPEQFAEIERSESIELEYLDEKNNLITVKKSGYEARILQHEIDHLSGKLFIDYLSSLKRNIIIKKLKKLKRKGEV